MQAYLGAVGPFPEWRGGDADPASAAVHTELAEAFEGLGDRLERLQLVVTHYPRPDLPGRCFALVVAFHDLPDPHIVQDRARYRRFLMRDGREPPMSGVLFEVRQVWQTAGGAPRLIEATVEVTDRLTAAGGRNFGSSMFSNARVSEITCDITRGGHFGQYGRGTRRGLIWCDRSQGIGPPEPWSAAYRVSPRRELVVGLADSVTQALRAFASRF